MASATDVQGVFERFLPAYRQVHRLDARRAKACAHIRQCRTPALGGLRLDCPQCGYALARYHACRDRHCPKCQRRASRRWGEGQCQALLPVTYYHLVFTLPHGLNPWVQLHPEVLYRELFAAVWGTLKAFGANPKRLGGELGMTAVLHTWGQNLSQHVHLHCLVPGGVRRADGDWKAARGDQLFPVRALSRGFRGRMVAGLRRAAEAGELSRITWPGEIARVLDDVMGVDWVVYSKPCIAATANVVGYLARYSHRIAISDQRILGYDESTVSFTYKDYADGGRRKTLTLSGEEFIRRYLLHILPQGFMRIRHYGFLANRGRREKLAGIRATLEQDAEAAVTAPVGAATGPAAEPCVDYPCPRCRTGRLRVVAELPPWRMEGG